MSKQDDGGSVFPEPGPRHGEFGPIPCDSGMTLRDWFAGQALPIVIEELGLGDSAAKIASYCYILADAMLEERKK